LLEIQAKNNIHIPGGDISFNADQLSVSNEDILKNLGMQLADADDYILTLIEQAKDVCFKHVKANACYAFIDNFSICVDKQEIVLNDKRFGAGKLVTSFLKKSEKIVVFTCTIGDDVEKESKRLMADGNALEGFLYDIIGSELAECVADGLHNHIEKLVAGYGMMVSNRYSPGYCNWSVSDQHKLFSLLNGNTCGITLTESSLMLPVKSVSGILGVGGNMRRLKYKCNICNDKDCILRKK
jgi:hypothetical protein